MKKQIAKILALALALSMTACSSDTGSGETQTNETTAVAAAVEDETTTAKPEETTVPEETTTEETTTEPVVEASPAEDFYYWEIDGEILITGYKGKDTEVIIPAEIDGKPVTAIECYAFQNFSKLTDITIPDSVREFPFAYAHWSHQDLPTLIVGGNLTMTPFDDTPWLEKKKEEDPLVIVNNIVIDGRNCSRDVVIPEGVTCIASGAFEYCSTITSVSLPESLEIIGDSAFFGCSRLTDIVIPDSVNKIGCYAFYSCSALENVTFPNNTVEMGECIFGGYDTWQKAIPWLENKIAENPLVIVNGNLINGQKCTGDVVIPDSIKSIASYSFLRCRAKSVQLPDGMTKIPDNIFNSSYIENVTIPDSVTEIGSYAFYKSGLESITIPNGVTKIGAGAFAGDIFVNNSYCKFESITIPGSVTEIGNYAFYDCENLTSVTLSEGLKKIGSQVFYRTNIKELTLPDSVESIAKDAFKDCNFDVTYKGEVYFPELYDELYKEINGQ